MHEYVVTKKNTKNPFQKEERNVHKEHHHIFGVDHCLEGWEGIKSESG